MTTLIEKRSDPACRRLREVRDGHDRTRLFAEGEAVVRDLVASPLGIDAIYCTKKAKPAANRLAGRRRTPLHVMSDDTMAFVSDLDTPPGVIAIAARPAAVGALPAELGGFLGLVLHGIQQPQNVGAMARSAEAAGVTRLWCTGRTADPFGPKALRAASGSLFRLPAVTGLSLAGLVTELTGAGIAVVGAFPRAKAAYDAHDWTGASVLVIGSEAHGFTDEEEALFERSVRIPMSKPVESLNAAMAATVCLFEAARQRRAAERA